jgi:hypothetical protein
MQMANFVTLQHNNFILGGVFVKNAIIKYVTREDVDLIDKLSNMYGSEISDEIYTQCMDEKNFEAIEDRIWKLMSSKKSKFSEAEFYEGLADEYEAVDECDKWSACVYNCDLLYMTAIAYVLQLKIPESSGDIEIFGL